MKHSTSHLGYSVLVVLMFHLAGCGAQPGSDILKRFENAESRYRSAGSSAQFLEVAALYESILKEVGESGEVLYNLGNAYFRAGEKGRAIASYRRAQRFRPTDSRLDANLRLALGVDTPRQREVKDTIFFWKDWLSYEAAWWVATLLVSSIFLLLMLKLLVPSTTFLSKRLLWALLPVTGIYLVSLGLRYYEVDVVENGVLVQDEVQARKGDSESYEPAFTELLKQGTEFRVLEKRGEWIRVEMDKGLEGWVPKNSATLY